MALTVGPGGALNSAVIYQYDAENRLRTETFSYQPEWSANGPTYTTKSLALSTRWNHALE